MRDAHLMEDPQHVQKHRSKQSAFPRRRLLYLHTFTKGLLAIVVIDRSVYITSFDCSTL